MPRALPRGAGRLASWAGWIALFAGAALAGLTSGVLFAYGGDLPQISALDNYEPSTITRVYDAAGRGVGDFAIQRRLLVNYDDISPTLRNAIIAAEDDGFNSHFGLSVSRILVTAVTDVLKQRLYGASTITQQVARMLFPIGSEKTPERKIKEILLALQIEKRYTKREILTFYCNNVHLGHGAYGVEAAARMYFAKSARDVTLEEAALLAGIIQTPARQSPFVALDRAKGRRDYVLQRMADEGMITQAVSDEAQGTLIRAVDRRGGNDTIAPFFVEEVRQHLHDKYGAKALYEGGLSVHTTLDARLQAAATQALHEGLRRVDKRQGFRRAVRNVIAEGLDLEAFKHDRWRRAIVPGDVVPAVVTRIVGARAFVRVGPYETDLGPAAFAWTRQTSAAALFDRGDLIDVRVEQLGESQATLRASLEQEPLVEGALVAIENRTGRLLAMVGGYSFERSKFNRAVQAYRQVGSLFKPFLYAAAIDRGYTPSSILLDAPGSFPAGPDQPLYEPQNYNHEYAGPITLRYALERSKNLPAVRLMATVGPDHVTAYSARFGFSRPIPPYLSTALGASESTLLEVTSAYSVFPNQGVRMEPYFILKVTDRDGHVLEENRPEAHSAIRADTAYVMTSLLRGVVEHGTAVRAAPVDWPLAGKTGTVDDYTDGWFVGFDPEISVGVWIGFNQKKTLFEGADGATIALPVWLEFMQARIATREEQPAFSPPGNIVVLTVDRASGQPIAPGAPNAIRETFVAGTEPGAAFPR